MCAACEVAKRHAELWAAGYVRTVEGHRQAFLDCGVPVVCLTSDHSVWVPCWAEQLKTTFIGSTALGPVLMRASCDEGFLDGLMTVFALADDDSEKTPVEQIFQVYEKALAFAVGQGVEIPPNR